MNSPLGFIIALQAERSSLTPVRVSHHTPKKLPSGHWLVLSGVGAWNAHYAATQLIGKNVAGLVSWGCAGALADSLHPGHLVLPDRIVGATGDVYFPAPDWQDRLLNALAAELTLTQGTLTESLGMVTSVNDKQSLRTTSGAVAVDMESAAIAAVAKNSQVPFVAIRAIADTAAMTLPHSVSRSASPENGISIPKLLAHAAWHPEEWMELKRLSTAFSAAHQTLKTVTERVSPNHFLFSSPITDA